MILKSIIEIPEGSFDKIEIKDGVPIVDRRLTLPMPVNYGFIPGTLEPDQDPLDAFCLSLDSLKTGQEVRLKIVGVFKCLDQGIQDNKVFGTLVGEKFSDITILKNLATVGDYLLNYKKGFEVLGYINYNPDVYIFKKLKRDLKA